MRSLGNEVSWLEYYRGETDSPLSVIIGERLRQLKAGRETVFRLDGSLFAHLSLFLVADQPKSARLVAVKERRRPVRASKRVVCSKGHGAASCRLQAGCPPTLRLAQAK